MYLFVGVYSTERHVSWGPCLLYYCIKTSSLAPSACVVGTQCTLAEWMVPSFQWCLWQALPILPSKAHKVYGDQMRTSPLSQSHQCEEKKKGTRHDGWPIIFTIILSIKCVAQVFQIPKRISHFFHEVILQMVFGPHSDQPSYHFMASAFSASRVSTSGGQKLLPSLLLCLPLFPLIPFSSHLQKLL